MALIECTCAVLENVHVRQGGTYRPGVLKLLQAGPPQSWLGVVGAPPSPAPPAARRHRPQLHHHI